METTVNHQKKYTPDSGLFSSIDLRGRQSVRATFRLTKNAVDTISIVAAHLGIKKKSLFDHLIGDFESLNTTAQDIPARDSKKSNRVQKTYVLSRSTLACVEEVSKSLGLPRDELVEYSVKRLLPIIEEERKKHKARKQMLAEIRQYLDQGEKLRGRYKALLGEDDPLYEKFMKTVASLRDALKSIRSFVEKVDMIEDF